MNFLDAKNIILVGFMGCGKSTLGKKIANKLDFTFVDLDSEIEKIENSSISDIFKNKGEAHFRSMEQQVLGTFSSQNNLVISTGGGTPCYFNNMELINQMGTSVYIQLPPLALVQRLQNEKSKRPLIAHLNESELIHFIEQKLGEREVFYNQSKIIFNPFTTSEAELIEYLQRIN